MAFRKRREALRAILTGSICIRPGSVYDATSIRIAHDLGFEVGMFGGSVASLAVLGDPDIALITLTELAEQMRRTHPHEKLASSVTQFVVGAVGDTDLELLALSNRLYRQYGLTRAYYSGFSPVIQTPFENLPATDPLREHRLYQASFLLRDYGWKVEDLPFLTDGNMELALDPKRAWAERYLRDAPIEIMTARRDQLLRLPGIGPVSANVILKARRQGKLTSLTDLQKLGIRTPQQASPYILLNGRRPLAQLSLFY